MRLGVLLATMSVSLTALGISAAHVPAGNQVRVVYNTSDSVPRGWYRIGAAGSLHVGDIVLAWLPAEAAAVAAQRGYLPAGIPLLKRIGAIAPQNVCIEGQTVSIGGRRVAVTKSADGQGRPMSVWQQCRRLSDGELFLLSATNPASFDSRYFGPIAASAVIGAAHPIWTWSRP
jgi:conjugative transfer signal peptidase TraF